jgi:glutamine amidotransferase
MIVLIDYGMGNLGSILNMLKKVGAQTTASSAIDVIRGADKLILPGVGAFDSAMRNLRDLGLLPLLDEKVIKNKTPILGVCLGMQLFTKRSEEGILPGLGWIDSETIRFQPSRDQANIKIPHMGWNTVKVNQESALFSGMDQESTFYFVHSYYVVCREESDILTTTHYGNDFVSSLVRGNIAGVQFHPEKSHKFGMKLLRNFVESF